MVAGEMLYSVSQWWLCAGAILVFLIAAEGGFQLGRRTRSSIDETARAQINTIQAAVLGLLALLLAFTSSMALSRFEVRKGLVLDESSAISTTYLRVQLLPEPYRRDLRDLLRHYVAVWLDFYAAGVDAALLQAARLTIAQLHQQLWGLAAAVNAQDPQAMTTGLFLQSLNEVIDLHAKRETALDNHVPESILLLLFLVAVCALGMIGYGFGFSARRHVVQTLTIQCLITLILFVIMDLDRPRRGLIKVGQQRMIELQRSLNEL